MEVTNPAVATAVIETLARACSAVQEGRERGADSVRDLLPLPVEVAALAQHVLVCCALQETDAVALEAQLNSLGELVLIAPLTDGLRALITTLSGPCMGPAHLELKRELLQSS